MLRFAPSTTADLNIGNLRVAILNHILSKQLNIELLIRIDDTDKKNNIEGKDKEILELLGLFSIDFSRVVYQSENIKYHTQMAMKLLLDKKAFNCFCSDEALELDKQKAKQEGKSYSYSGFCQTISDETKFNCNAPFVVRLKKPEQPIQFKDLIKGELSYKANEVDSFVILKHDKSPTGNFASAVDDMLSDISTVIRSEEQLSYTPKQIHVRESLGYDKKIQYIHLPDISNLGKEDSSSVKYFIDEGYLPVAIANYCVQLGYNTPKDIFTIEEAIEWFDIGKISKEPIKFDRDKLNFINKEYLQAMDELRLSKILGYADKDLGTLGKIYLEECNTTKEIKSKLDGIFSSKKSLESFEQEFKIVKESLINAPFIEDFEEFTKYIAQKSDLKGEKLMIPLYYAITGTKSGPDLKEIYPLIKNYLGEIVK
jgi:glutamyl-tRNA synthetase